jgi:hypothetical protein
LASRSERTRSRSMAREVAWIIPSGRPRSKFSAVVMR